MNNHKVVVTGKIDPQKVMKKLRKKTGKKVEIVINGNEDKDHNIVEGPKDGTVGISCGNHQGGDWSLHNERDLQADNIMGYNYNSYYDHDRIDLTADYNCCINDTEMLLMMFNDEDPNACSVM
ncbi:Heavy metal transport/detoxification superfamily protein [Parasponia andersonii]|uniref:Heavy metal transport/detoxification superfamily protein n=1 Tax=Parasponia andersonii TaxID=3476 RepID=A0A2P5E417_PARAD|nr:Heavy metal transport/detoxification superfamily protein [Parasponia andersonii]